MTTDDDDAPTPFDAAQLCARIEQLVEVLEWSWDDLKEKAGVTRRTLHLWKTGAAVPPKGYVRRAANALGVEYEEITHGLRATAAPSYDPTLIARAMGGDRPAVHALVAILTETIRTTVARELARWGKGRATDQEVADTTQAVFLHLFADGWRVLQQWDPGRGMPLQSFVSVVARNLTYSTLRTQRRSPWSEEPTAPEVFDEGEFLGSGPESLAIGRDMAEQLAGRISAGLSERGAEMFQLLFVESRPIEDVCSRTGMSPEAVYQWKSRLAKRLREIAAELSPASSRPANDTAEDQAATNCRSTSFR